MLDKSNLFEQRASPPIQPPNKKCISEEDKITFFLTIYNKYIWKGKLELEEKREEE